MDAASPMEGDVPASDGPAPPGDAFARAGTGSLCWCTHRLHGAPLAKQRHDTLPFAARAREHGERACAAAHALGEARGGVLPLVLARLVLVGLARKLVRDAVPAGDGGERHGFRG